MTALSCAWCGVPVHTPHRGWEAGQAAYCPEHVVVAGRHPHSIGVGALTDAIDLQDCDTGEFLRWPWRDLHEMAGILVPRRVYYVAAFPGNGKTSFLSECFASWIHAGHHVTYLPLESDASETMTRVACSRIGVSADDALSLRLRERMEQGDPAATHQWQELQRTFAALRNDKDFLYQFRIDPTSVLSPKRFEQVIKACDAMQSAALIVDHVDHSEGDADDHSPEIRISNRIQQMSLDAARALSIPVILATQLNSSRTGGDRLAHYRPPLMDWLYNKGKKDQIGAVCLGLYRPIDPAKTEEIKQVRAGMAEPRTITKSHRMGVAGMKLRFGGDKKEATVELKYERGRLSDLDPADEWADASAEHGIPTGSPSMRRMS